ncbi:alpha/beta fold hydrolase [Euzebya sp.]|uniref:alpha/beta fold hydrolase n=1 Tax=Euzebya sp. TaxID=1971409 RepID=UPI003518871D
MTEVTGGTLDVGLGPIEYVEIGPATGEGEGQAPLVFLHEGLGSVELWRSFPTDVVAATGRRALVFSRHGYGASAVVREPRGVDYMHREGIDVLPAVLDALGYDDPVLVGHSDGASIALIAAGSGAVEPAGLVLLAPHVIVEDRSIEGIERAKQVYETTDMGTRMGRYHADADATFWGWNDIWLDPAFRAWDIRDVLAGVRCPTLCVQGVDDEYGTMRQLDEIADRVRGPVTRIELEDCGHAPHLDRPEATREAVTRFVADL